MKLISLIIALCILASQSHSIAEEMDGGDSSGNSRDHHFFVGVNFSIPYEEEFYPIERIWNRRAHIRVGDQTVVESIRHIKELRYSKKTKISQHFAEITDLDCEPGYSRGQDPKTIAAQNQMTLADLSSAASGMSDTVTRWAMQQDDNPGGDGYGTQPMPGMEVSALDPFAEADKLRDMAQNFENQRLSFEGPEGSGRPSWDLLNVSFSIKADRFLPSGHLAFIFNLKEEPEGEPVMTWFHFLTLKNISPEEKSYNYQVRSYPIGLYVDSQELFLYSNGSEIATNLSPKHVSMTAEGARKYLNYQYCKENEGATKSPERAWKYLSNPDFDNSTTDLSDETITLKIDEDGLVTDLIMSSKLRRSLSPQYINEITSQMYLPALENGKPVAGDLDLTLRDVVF